MTTQEIIDYYSNLLIIQYKGKPKAKAHIELLADAGIIDQLPIAVQNAYNVETATGVQLNVIGQYVGVVRSYGAITLSDNDFRSLIKIAIIKNSANSDLFTLQSLINTFFNGTIYVFDYKGMRVSFFLNTSLGSSDFAKLALAQNILPFPMGVMQSSTIFTSSSNIQNFFGMCSYELPAFRNKPFNTYTVYDSVSPWLDYSLAVT